MAIKRQTILTNLKTRLQTISVANGYYSALGSNVKLFSAIPVENDELPSAIIFDKQNTFEADSFSNTSNYFLQNLIVEIIIVCGGNTIDTTARQIIADVYKAIGTDETLSGACLDILPVSDVLELQHESNLIASATINLIIKYRTTRFQES